MIRHTLAIAWKDMLIVLKDKGALAVYFLMPLLFASLMGIAFANTSGSGETAIEIAIIVANQDRGTYGQMVVDGLKQATVLAVTEENDPTAADRLVAEGQAAAALIIPADLSDRIDAGETAAITLIKDPAQQEAANIVAGVTNQAMAEIGMLAELRYGVHAVTSQSPGYDKAPPEMAAAAEAQTLGVIWTAVQQMRQSPVIAVEETAVANTKELEDWNPMTYNVPGFTVAFAFFLVGTMASTLLAEKEEGTFRRLMSSPMPRGAVITGKILAYVGIVFLQVIVMFTAGSVFFRMPLGEAPLALALLTLALALASASMGILLGTFCHSSKQADQLGMVLGFVLLALGGTIFPVWKAPGLMGILCRFTPSAWAIEAYMGMFADGWTLARITPNILALLGFAVAFAAVAIRRFRFE
ncbi:MAG: ABC transporter permease [Anaerolineae bacterium]|jgi:ABC-2 type transport system permease protein|nr:ABC transporter permease [Anaerolineae bacterium]